MPNIKLLTFLIFLFLALLSSDLFALEIVIEDSSGNIKHVSEVQSNANVRFQVNNSEGKPIDGALISITQKEGKETRQGAVLAGIVEFLDVTPGHWVVDSDSDNLVLAEIIVSDFSDSSTIMAQSAELGGSGAGGFSTAGLLGAAGIAGGITALGVTLSDDNGKDPSPSD